MVCNNGGKMQTLSARTEKQAWRGGALHNLLRLGDAASLHSLPVRIDSASTVVPSIQVFPFDIEVAKLQRLSRIVGWKISDDNIFLTQIQPEICRS